MQIGSKIGLLTGLFAITELCVMIANQPHYQITPRRSISTAKERGFLGMPMLTSQRPV